MGWLQRGVSVFLGASLAACQISVHIPSTLYTPTIAGIVTASTQGPGRTNVYTLRDGSSITFDYAVTKVLADGGGNGSVGDLLLADETSTWTVSLRESSIRDVPPGCFVLGMPGVDDGDHIDFPNGLRLPKAAAFDSGIYPPSDGEYRYPQVSFCVDSGGMVTRYGLVPYPSSGSASDRPRDCRLGTAYAILPLRP